MKLDQFQIETMRSVLRKYWKDAGHSHEAPDALCDDAARFRFLVQHWHSAYKGMPLHRYIEENLIRDGGIEAILDDAMSVVKLRGG